MSATAEYFAAITRAPDCQAGRLTLAQCFELSQSVSNISTVCAHVLHGHEVCGTFEKRLAAIADNSGLSIARARAICEAWHRWTSWRDGGSELPTLSQVTSFLCCEAISKLL